MAGDRKGDDGGADVAYSAIGRPGFSCGLVAIRCQDASKIIDFYGKCIPLYGKYIPLYGKYIS